MINAPCFPASIIDVSRAERAARRAMRNFDGPVTGRFRSGLVQREEAEACSSDEGTHNAGRIPPPLPRPPPQLPPSAGGWRGDVEMTLAAAR